MNSNTHNTVPDPDKACTKSSKKYKKDKLMDYKYTVIRMKPHYYFKRLMESHYVKLQDAEHELRKKIDFYSRIGKDCEVELITYQEYLDRMKNNYYNLEK